MNVKMPTRDDVRMYLFMFCVFMLIMLAFSACDSDDTPTREDNREQIEKLRHDLDSASRRQQTVTDCWFVAANSNGDFIYSYEQCLRDNS